VNDTNTPPQLTSFSELALNDKLLRALDDMDIDTPTDVQAQAIPVILEGKDIQVSAETGSGKTAAFILPSLQKILEIEERVPSTHTLILTPTRELARQIVKQTEKMARFTGIKAVALTGGQEVKYQAALLRKDPEIVVATPGRLVEHIKLKNIALGNLSTLVFDEADRMFDMGFAEDMEAIMVACEGQHQTMLFSATLKHSKVAGFARQALKDPVKLTTNDGALPDSITQQIVLCDDEKHKDKVTAKLLHDSQYEKAIVFTNTKHKAGKLEAYLRYMGLRCGVIHGDFSQDERLRILNLLRTGTIDILVATDVAARGIDVDGVDLVINYDMTRSGDEHAHRTGRTGRAGKEGTAISLVASSEWNLMHGIERYLKIQFQHRKVAGLEAKFKGPKKLKASGKAAGKKKKDKKASPAKPVKKKAVKKKRPASPANVSSDGMAPLKRNNLKA
jgi:ATP-dependent RNA helicase SrmB